MVNLQISKLSCLYFAKVIEELFKLFEDNCKLRLEMQIRKKFIYQTKEDAYLKNFNPVYHVIEQVILKFIKSFKNFLLCVGIGEF